MAELSAKARAGRLTAEEESLIDSYARADRLINLMQVKARLARKQASSNEAMEAGLRKAVWERAQSLCEYCRRPPHLDRLMLAVEHVIPEKHEGATDVAMLAYRGTRTAPAHSSSSR